MKKRLSIIIVTYNSENDIYDCIASIHKYSDIPISDIEIIVVDNNSRDTKGMFEKLKGLYENNIVLIENTHNGGYGQGNNVGIRYATAPVILIMNPDVRLITPIFKDALAYFEKDERLGMLGMKQMLTAHKKSNNSFICIDNLNGYFSIILNAICTRFDIYIQRWMYFSGSCFYIRKSMFEAIGLFDEDIFMYGEENDIHYRMREKFGACFKYVPRLRYIHLTLERVPTVDFLKKLLQSAIKLNKKKNISEISTIKNRQRSNRILLIRESLRIKSGKKDHTIYNALKEYDRFLSRQIKIQNK